MRKAKFAITRQEKIAELLEKGRVGRLATLDAEGFPYVVPLNYVWWQEAVYFHCARKGEKLDNIARNDRVGFEVDFPLAYLDSRFDQKAPPCSVSQFYFSVIIRGRAELVTAIEEKLGALNALMASHEKEPGYQKIKEAMPAVELCSVVAIRVSSLSAKANLAQNKSCEKRQAMAHYLQQRGLPGDLEAARFLEEQPT